MATVLKKKVIAKAIAKKPAEPEVNPETKANHMWFITHIDKHVEETKTGPMKPSPVPRPKKVIDEDAVPDAKPKRRGRITGPFEPEMYSWICERIRENTEERMEPWLETEIAKHKWTWLHWNIGMYNDYAALHQLAAFRVEHGHLPRTIRPGSGGDALPHEKILGRWISKWRNAFKKDKLPEEFVEHLQAVMLDSGEDIWVWDPIMQKHRECIDKLVDFVNTTGNWPKGARGTSDEAKEEKMLAQWITARRLDKRKERLSTELSNMIEEHFTDFPWESPRSAKKPASETKSSNKKPGRKTKSKVKETTDEDAVETAPPEWNSDEESVESE